VRRRALLPLLAAAGLLAGCSAARPGEFVDRSAPASPAKTWTPPAEAARPSAPPVAPAEIPADLLSGKRTVSLAEAVDVALSSSPVTRRSWLQARSAAADVGSRQAPFWPMVEIDGSAGRGKTVSLGGKAEALLTTYGPSAALNWMLFDFGARSADVEAARQTLFAFDFSHNAAVSDVVLLVQSTYYQYQAAKALLAASEASLKQAEEALAAAEERRRAGVATIADVLQAKTTFSQRRLDVESARGLIETTRGALATALGVPANVPVDVSALPDGLRLEGTTPSVEELIARAAADRPDLAAAKARAASLWSRAKAVRASALPSLSGNALWSRTYFEGSDALTGSGDNYSAGLFLRIPVFTGFQKTYDRKRAEEDAKAADAFSESLSQQVALQIWSGYYSVLTAAQKIRAAKDLLDSARESDEVAMGRYKAGVGSILDLLAAETALASARSTDVQARATFLVALAQLAHDAGSLGLPSIPQLKRQ
jgi:outer membrane protein